MHLLELPSELLVEILLYLEDTSLASASICNKRLSHLCSSEILWRRLSSPFGVSDRDQTPSFSYKALYRNLLTKYAWLLGMWQSDYTFHGSLLLVAFDPKSAAIRGTLIQAQHAPPEQVINVWSLDRGVVIIDPKFEVYGQDLFLISLNNLGHVSVQILQPGIVSQLSHQQGDTVEIVQCIFERHENCPHLWSSVRDAMRSKNKTINSTSAAPYNTRNQHTYAFTFSLASIVSHEQRSTVSSKYSHIPLQSSMSRTPFNWMSDSNAWIDEPPRFCKLPSSLTGIPDAIQLSHLNKTLGKQSALTSTMLTNSKSTTGFPVGLFKCHYGSHGLEYLIIRYNETNHTLVCNKVTGDLNIPRSEISWIVPDTRSPLRVCEEEEFRSALSYEALGHVAYQGYTGNRMIPAERESTLYDKMLITNQ
ncbi:unnamed protein product [Umbelopsis vinacea]